MFLQYEENVLESSLYVLCKVGRLAESSRCDPVKVARHISAIVSTRLSKNLIKSLINQSTVFLHINLSSLSVLIGECAG